MHHLGVPTSRALSLCTTGEDVRRDMFYDGRPAMEPGAIVARTAPSFVRFGSFQMLAADGDADALRALMQYTVTTHEPHHQVSDDAVVAWLTDVAERAHAWSAAGCATVRARRDEHRQHVHPRLDHRLRALRLAGSPRPVMDAEHHGLPGRRYRYAAQPDVVGWNLARLLEAVAMVMDDPEPLHGVLDAYREAYRNARQQAWVERLGLDAWTEADEALVRDLQHVMHASEVDHVPMLRHMAEGLTTAEALKEAGRIYAVEPDLAAINAWLGRWLEQPGRARSRHDVDDRPGLHAPQLVLQLAIDEAERGDWTKAEALAARLMRPFERLPEDDGAWWSGPRPEWAMTRPGCSMLSCSS